MKYYKISEKQLLSLLEDSHKLGALEIGGVTSWEWYIEALRDYVHDESKWFDDLAIENLKNYEEI